MVPINICLTAGLIQEYCQDTLKGPFNHAARAVAGVPRHWYDTSAPPPRNGERSSALESKAKLEAKRRDAKLSGGGGIVGLESGSEGLGQGEDSIAETSGVSSEGFGANGVRLRGLLVDGVGVDVRSTTNGREPAGGVGHSNPETDESVRRGETKGSGRVGNSEDGEVKVRASIRDLRTNEMTSSAASCEDGHFPERGLQRNGKLPETETKVATHSGHGESTIVNEPTGTRAELFPSRADAPDSGQSSSPHSSRSREDSPAQPDSSRIRKAESEGDLRSGKHERGEVASDAEPLPDEDIEALSQVRRNDTSEKGVAGVRQVSCSNL